MNFKEILRNIGQYLLIGSVFLGIVFIIVGLKSSSVNWWFVGIGGIILIPFVILWLKLNYEADKNEKRHQRKFQQFLKKADRVHVFFEAAKIVEKKYTERTNVSLDYRAAALNEISGNGHYNENYATHVYCEVQLETMYKGEKIVLDEIIHKDATTVRMYFYQQKATTLYVDPKNPSSYYLDLTFIEK